MSHTLLRRGRSPAREQPPMPRTEPARTEAGTAAARTEARLETRTDEPLKGAGGPAPQGVPEDGQPLQLRRILRLFHAYRGRLAVVGLLVGLSSLVSLASPFMLREILDVALPQRRTGLLALLALGMIAVAVANSVFNVLQTYMSTTVGQRVMHDLRTAVYG